MLRPSKIAQRREQTGDRQGNDIQRLPQEIARLFNLLPFARGQLVKNVTFAAGVDKTVDHGLGRRPQCVLVIRDYGANVCTGVGEATAQPAYMDLTKQINLRAPVACTVDLWVS